ncbi:MAG TPA: sigma factor-like helix-turn-helix DNA-binding protein [Candidatus Dormibacteraeota bacterium]
MAPALIQESPPATLGDDVEDVLATLTPRERRVLLLRYVLVDSRERTAEEVGRRLGVPGERITRIEAEALAKLEMSSGRGRYTTL